MSRRTYNDLSLEKTYSNLENQWRQIKANQSYGLSQQQIYTYESDKLQSSGSSENYSLAKSGVFIPQVFPCLFGAKLIFYQDNAITTIDPVVYGIDGRGCNPFPYYNPSYKQYVINCNFDASSSQVESYDRSGNRTITPSVHFWIKLIFYSTSKGQLIIS